LTTKLETSRSCSVGLRKAKGTSSSLDVIDSRGGFEMEKKNYNYYGF